MEDGGTKSPFLGGGSKCPLCSDSSTIAPPTTSKLRPGGSVLTKNSNFPVELLPLLSSPRLLFSTSSYCPQGSHLCGMGAWLLSTFIYFVCVCTWALVHRRAQAELRGQLLCSQLSPSTLRVPGIKPRLSGVNASPHHLEAGSPKAQAEVDLEFLIFLPLLPKFWDCWSVLPHHQANSFAYILSKSASGVPEASVLTPSWTRNCLLDSLSFSLEKFFAATPRLMSHLAQGWLMTYSVYSVLLSVLRVG